MNEQWFRDLARHHRYKIIGSVGGLVIALLIIRFGPWWTLFILFLSGLGYWVGKRLDEEPETLMQILERLIPPGGR